MEDAQFNALEEAEVEVQGRMVESLLGCGATGSSPEAPLAPRGPILPDLTASCEKVLHGFCSGAEARLIRALERMITQENWNALHESAKVRSTPVAHIGQIDLLHFRCTFLKAVQQGGVQTNFISSRFSHL